MKTNLRFFFFTIFLIAIPGVIQGQTNAPKMIPSGKNAERIIKVERLQEEVEFLCDTLFHGRATGSKGANEAAFWIARRFRKAGLMRMGGKWSRSFEVSPAAGHNIIGFMPGMRSGLKEQYVIVTAHYDSHGSIAGNVYPGADSNASGVVALLSIADMFARMKELGRSYGKNLIFVATDARERNSLGAEALWSDIQAGRLKDPVSGETITPEKIYTTVVLDILGSSLSPIHHGRKDYLIMLGGAGLKYQLVSANDSDGLNLDLGFDYYGSEGFTEMFLSKIGDQGVFSRAGVPCTVFTSGITMKTNKIEDDALSLNYNVFKRRIFLIFHWLTKVL